MATPALMVLIVAWLPKLIGRPISTKMRWVMAVTVVAALAAYLMFIRYGYQAAEVGDKRLPLSVVAATLNVTAWYLFAALYYHSTRPVSRTRPFRFWDAALVFMILAFLGAWGVAIISRLGPTKWLAALLPSCPAAWLCHHGLNCSGPGQR